MSRKRKVKRSDSRINMIKKNYRKTMGYYPFLEDLESFKLFAKDNLDDILTSIPELDAEIVEHLNSNDWDEFFENMRLDFLCNEVVGKGEKRHEEFLSWYSSASPEDLEVPEFDSDYEEVRIEGELDGDIAIKGTCLMIPGIGSIDCGSEIENIAVEDIATIQMERNFAIITMTNGTEYHIAN